MTENRTDTVGSVFIARQPILTDGGDLYGYELLHREGHLNSAPVDVSDDRMSAESLVNAYLRIGIGRLTGNKRAFLNFGQQLLVDRMYLLVNKELSVIEVLERVDPTAEVVEACRDCVAQGYTLALDDFVHSRAHEPLLDIAHVVKVDVLGRTPAELEDVVTTLRRWNVRLLAERVETVEVRDTCRRLGFTLFQGYYFARPEVSRHRRMSESPVSIIRLLAMLRDETTTDARIEREFQGNVALTLKLLRAVNSASVGGRGITSIRHAVQILGHAELMRWLALMLVTSLGAKTGADSELISIVLRRARMCEMLSSLSGNRSLADASFIVGLFSLLDVVLKAPMEDLLSGLDLAPELTEALRRREGPMGRLLELVELFERGEWDGVIAEAATLHIPMEHVSEAYAEGMDWAATRLGAPDMAAT